MEDDGSSRRRRQVLLLRALGFLLPVQPPADQFKNTPAQGEQRDDKEFNKSEVAVHPVSLVYPPCERPKRQIQIQLTSGGIELRMVSMLPPVCSPNMVPRS